MDEGGMMAEGAGRQQAAARWNVRALLNARCFGFTCLRAWVYLLFLDATSTFIAGPENGGWLMQTYVYSSLALSVTLFASAAGKRTGWLLARNRGAYVGAALAACLGTLCIACSWLPGAPAALFCVLGGVATGVGSGLIDLCYGELYSRDDTRRVNYEVPFAFFLAAALFCCLAPLPTLASSIVCSLLPLASAALLHVAQGKAAGTAPADAGETLARIEIGPFAGRIGLCALLVGIGDGIVRAVCLNSSGLSPMEFYQLPLVFGAALTMAVIYLCVLATPPQRGGGLRTVYRSVVFVMAVFYMLLPLLQGFSLVECTLALTGYGTFNVLIWLLLAEIAHRNQLNSATVYGIGWGMVTLGVLIGAFLGRLVVAAQMPLSAVALFATLAIIGSYLFVLNESDLAAIVTPAELVAFADAAEGPEPLSAQADPEADDAPADNASDAEPHRMRFMESCDLVAAEFGLTPKETEIMVLYAKGRTSTHIQQELYLSRGTVTTHLRHIYQKIGVHSKQELLDAIEARRTQM